MQCPTPCFNCGAVMFAAEALSTRQRLTEDQIDQLDDAVKELLHQHEEAVDEKDKETQESVAAELRDLGYHLTRGTGAQCAAGIYNVSVAKFSQCCGKGTCHFAPVACIGLVVS